MVIVGTGAAGLSVAGALRSRGYSGELVLVGDESCVPYDRPPLSKQVLAGEWDPARATLLPQARVDSLGARFLLGQPATGLDTVARVVSTEGGELHYDALVIATGVRPRTLRSVDVGGVQVLRTLEQAVTLRNALGPDVRFLVVGAGFLGLEAAATARSLGASVTVIEPLRDPLASRLGADAAGRLIELHRSHGVEIVTGATVEEFVGPRAGPAEPYVGSSGEPAEPTQVSEVRLNDGRVIGADVVLVAIGCVPNVEWLAGSGVPVDDGVVCDERCEAVPGIWAGGDVARWLHVGLGRHVRLEHRTNASEQGAAVARTILGDSAPFQPVPFFWTDQYDVKIQVAGCIPPGAAGTVVEDDPERGSFVRAFHEGERLVGVLGWNAPREMVPYRRALESQKTEPRNAR